MESDALQKCKHNAQCIISQLEDNHKFLHHGHYVEEGPFCACIMTEGNDTFTKTVRRHVAFAMLEMFKGATGDDSVELVNAANVETALTSIEAYGERDGQWIISSLQEPLPNPNAQLHTHLAPAFASRAPEMARLLIIYHDSYVDLSVVFVRVEERIIRGSLKKKKRRINFF